jgi:hypothetical protein
MAELKERLDAEIDRQLAEVRAACDGFATRAGLLIAATGIGASAFATRIGKVHSGHFLVPTFTALAVAALAGVCTVIPWLRIGVVTGDLTVWADAPPEAALPLSAAAVADPPLPAAAVTDPRAPRTIDGLLRDAKIGILGANLWRKRTMHALLAIQAIATMVAVGLALWAARK